MTTHVQIHMHISELLTGWSFINNHRIFTTFKDPCYLLPDPHDTITLVEGLEPAYVGIIKWETVKAFRVRKCIIKYQYSYYY